MTSDPRPWIHWLWYFSLFVEAVVLARVLYVDQMNWFAGWLMFDLLTAAVGIIIDQASVPSLYRYFWVTATPPQWFMRTMAARATWKSLGGRPWTRAGVAISAAVCITETHGWPNGILEFEFIAIACVSLSLALILWLSVLSGMRQGEPFYINVAHIMIGYFLANALCYLIMPAYRDIAGQLTGVVAVLSYSVLACVWIGRHRRQYFC